MTPRQLWLFVDEYSKKREAEQDDERMKLYLLAAMVSRWVWQKHLPSFEKVFPKPKKAMTDEEMFSAFGKVIAQMKEVE